MKNTKLRLKSMILVVITTLSLVVVETKAQIHLPFHLVNGYILVDAEVNNVKGRFLFDTGTPFNFMLNNNFIPLDKNSFMGTGQAGSNQVLGIYKSNIERIKITHTELDFINLQNVTHTNFGFMQDSIASDILGTMGYEIMKDYVITLDYDRQIIKMDSVKIEIPDSKMITAFQYANEGNFPEVIFMAVNGRKINVYFDTGSQGVMKFSKNYFRKLSDENLIEVYNTDFWYGYAFAGFQSYLIRNLSYKNVVFDLKHLSLIPGDENEISLGYSFLKDYLSIWDFKNKVISLYNK